MNLKSVNGVSSLKSVMTVSLSLLLSSPLAQADWNFGLEGGTEINDGTENTRLRLRASNDGRPFSQLVYAEWRRDSDANNSYEIGYVPRFWFTDNAYLFGDGRFGVNGNLFIDQSRYLVGGVGYEPIRTATTTVFAEIGAGAQEFDFESGEETSEAIGVARAVALHRPADNVQLSAEIDANRGEDVERADFEVGISLRIPTGSLRYSYRKQWLRVDGGELVEDDAAFFSYGFGF